MIREELVIIGAIGLLSIVVASLISYWVATLGHPTAVWFWRGMLGLM